MAASCSPAKAGSSSAFPSRWTTTAHLARSRNLDVRRERPHRGQVALHRRTLLPALVDHLHEGAEADGDQESNDERGHGAAKRLLFVGLGKRDEAHDLAASKLAAFRDNDVNMVSLISRPMRATPKYSVSRWPK